MIKIGLVGAGHLGSIHLRLLKESPDFELVSVYDANPAVRQRLAEQGHSVAASYEALLGEVEAVDIVTPTIHHFECARLAMEANRHVFIEKPLTSTLAEAEAPLSLWQERPGLQAQVGHVERFNPGFLAIAGRSIQPMFIEGHRLAIYNPRGTDVSVVFDLMIHDLDIVLSLVNSPIKEIHASGVAVISESTDIANARIEFENGAVANLTASRISAKNMRRLRFFQRNTYLAVDFLEKKAEIFRLSDQPADPDSGAMSLPMDNGSSQRFLVFEQPAAPSVNAIGLELSAFASAIRGEAEVPVGLDAGYQALKAAHQIAERIDLSLKRSEGLTFS